MKTKGNGDNKATKAPKGGKTIKANKNAKTTRTGSSKFCDCGSEAKVSAAQKTAIKQYCVLS